MKFTLTTLLISSIAFSGITMADENYNHFPSLDAPDLKTALCNLKNYNLKLTVITDKTELTAIDMVKVHELTYTLENALQKLQSDLTAMAADLEEVHQASEKLAPDTLKRHSEKYVAQSNLLLASPTDCKS